MTETATQPHADPSAPFESTVSDHTAPEQLVARMIHLAAIQPSQTPMQAHRRARFNKEALKELTDNVAQIGVLQPILVRPIPPKKGVSFEIVAGERRYLAAKGAALDTLPAVVRELTDLEVIEVQVIENLQREGLHELEEAEGYEQLMNSHAYTAEQIAARVGKSKAYVYGRLKLCALGKDSRKAFYDGKLNASTALLLARIPVEDLQRQALKEITEDRWGGAMSYRQAAEHVHDKFMLQLGQASFKTGDPDLLPAAGACGPCPKRTGNQPELFGDVKSKDVCTDPKCFAAKKAAHMEQLRKEAEARGQEVIAGAAAKKVKPNSYSQTLQGGYVALDQEDLIGGKFQTVRKALGKDMPQTKLLQDPHKDGEMIEIADAAEVARKLKAKGIKTGSSSSSGSGSATRAAQLKHERTAKMETEYRRALFDAIHVQPVAIDHDVLAQLALYVYDKSPPNEVHQVIDPLHGLNAPKVDPDKVITGLDDSQLARLLVDCMLVGEIRCSSYQVARTRNPQSDLLNLLAKKAKVDAAAIRKPIQDAFDAREQQRAERGKKSKTTAKTKAAAGKKPAKKPATAAKPGATVVVRATKESAAGLKSTTVRDTWPFPIPDRQPEPAKA